MFITVTVLLCSYVFQDYKRASVVMDRYTDKTFGV